MSEDPIVDRILGMWHRAQEQREAYAAIILRIMQADNNRRVNDSRLRLQGEEVKKNTIRFLFLGDRAGVNAAWFHKNLELSKFFHALELDQEHEDAVTIEIGAGDPLTQYQLILTLLESVDSVRVVGARCPQYKDGHQTKGRFLFPTHGPNGDEVMCLGCRRKFSLSFNERFMDMGDMKTAMQLEIIRHIRPMPFPENKLIPIDTETTGLRAEPNINWDVFKGRMSKKERDDTTKKLLGADYASVEIATLFHTLGMRHTIDVMFLADYDSTIKASDWLDQGGGAVLVVDSGDDIIKAKGAIASWIRKNQSSTRYGLAIVEIDKSKLNTNIMNSKVVQQTASGLAKVREDLAKSSCIDRSAILKEFAEPLIDDSPPKFYKSGRAVSKSTSFAMSTEMLLEETGIDQAEAKKLIERFYKAWPSLQKWHQMAELTRLTVENEKLRDDLKESDEALSVSNTKLDGFLNQQKVQEQLPQDRLVKDADAMLRFLAGLNLQDHSIAEQREFNEKFSALKKSIEADAIHRGKPKG